MRKVHFSQKMISSEKVDFQWKWWNLAKSWIFMKIHARNVENPKEILLFSPSGEKVWFYMKFHFFLQKSENSDVHENSENSVNSLNSCKNKKSAASSRDREFIKFHEIPDDSLKMVNSTKFHYIHQNLVNFSLFR